MAPAKVSAVYSPRLRPQATSAASIAPCVHSQANQPTVLQMTVVHEDSDSQRQWLRMQTWTKQPEEQQLQEQQRNAALREPGNKL